MEPSVRPYNPSGPVDSSGSSAGVGEADGAKGARSRSTRSGRRSGVVARAPTKSSRAKSPQAEPELIETTGDSHRDTANSIAAPDTLETLAGVDVAQRGETLGSAHAGSPVEEADAQGAQEEREHEVSPDVVGVADFEDIFTRFQTPLINFVFRLVGNREQACDLTQDVFVKAYKALSGGTTIQRGALSSWLYRIASNTATDALRRRRLISWLPLSLFNEDRGVGAGMPGADSMNSQQGPSEELLNGATSAFSSGYDGGRFEQRVADREVVERVLKKLPPKYATCLLLYEHEGFSCAEIAEVLNVSPSAVKMRLMRARERFITLYQQEVSGQE
ncbi:MAG: RNA polymerase sigma factor [Ktedonobacterales bacterium]